MAKSMGRPLGRTSSASPTSTVFLPRHVMSVEYHPRDKYGFKKKTTEVTVEQYDRWYDKYEGYVKRRTKKWEALMKKHDCSMDDPCRFPERNDTVKRYARKGYPPQWRGAMWWYYSGGQMTLGQKTGVYDALLMRCKLGELNETDRELIERDLHRTFPDNIHFKPDEVKTPDNLIGATTEEPDMIRSLRNVLQVFAMNNPSIGYCQSLNFIAGLLLLFLKQDEERVFILMEIITHHHLPGAHARSLMNVDVGALMMLVQEYLPTVWNSINDIDIINSGAGSSAHPASKHARLPSVNIACTSWFMSLFIGTLPIETVLRVWDAFLYEGPKALFRYALAIFKTGEAQIRRCPADSPELFQIVQNLPRKCLDPNELYKIAFARRPFGNLNQGIIDSKRAFWKEEILKQREEHAKLAEGQKDGLLAVQTEQVEGEKENGGLKRKMSRRFLKRSASKKNLKV
ncbi:RabGAP/TBC [Zopfia rhizophila CBS 207.26]|uniref:RabGAP/TBC n=1 Tax=Zopfia rhizophila CBS 207.26 TaxID=1314779 RepID=A0A6A6EKV3_9PEZI|nr:RabGAP/TBC [Zopfia rhizophila CBS 207.26]